MNEQITTSTNKFVCSECQNEVEIPEKSKVGDVIECQNCGIEFEIISIEGETTTLQIIEEEK